MIHTEISTNRSDVSPGCLGQLSATSGHSVPAPGTMEEQLGKKRKKDGLIHLSFANCTNTCDPVSAGCHPSPALDKDELLPPSKSVLSVCDAEVRAFSEQCGYFLLSQPRTSYDLNRLTATRLVHTRPTCRAVRSMVVNQWIVEEMLFLSCEHIKKQRTRNSFQSKM